MPSPRITSGERRGLIVLIIILVIATVLLCWRDSLLQHRTDDIPGDPAVPVSVMADSLLSSPDISSPDISSPQDTVSVIKERKNGHEKHVRKTTTHSKNTTRPNPTAHPATRSPRDERVD